MSEENKDQNTAAQKRNSDSGQDKNNLVQKLTRYLLIFCCIYFIYYLAAERFTPSTSQARVRGTVVPIAAQVPGIIEKIHIEDNAIVEPGDLILQIERHTYEFAVKKAEAELESAVQEVDAGGAEILSAQARLEDAQAEYTTVKINSERVFKMEGMGILPESDFDKVRGQLAQAQAGLRKAQADLRKAQEQLGKAGEENSRIQLALAKLNDARLDLAQTTITAPFFGTATNLKLGTGQYANTGAPLLTFISAENVWIEAYLRENNLENIRPGNKVELTLDSSPGQVFSAEVKSIGFGVKFNQNNQTGALPSIAEPKGWLREAQRFPVIIDLTDDAARGRLLLREGGQADVIVYTGDGLIMNALGWLNIRIKSILSYAY